MHLIQPQPKVIDQNALAWLVMSMCLERLINPSSIAVVGASERPSIGRSVIENLKLIDFSGRIMPVNPKYQQVLGLECRPALDELDMPPELVIMCIGSTKIMPHYRILPEIGAGAAVIFDGGFSESGEEGEQLQAEIAAISSEAGIALCGPNCMGILNLSRSSTSYAQLTHDPGQLLGNVGLISHSGSVCIGLMTDTRRFGFSVVISSGNEAVVTAADYLDYLVQDPATKVIAMFIETVRSPDKFVAALDCASKADKPVVVLNVGQTERARKAISSHTGGLASEPRVLSEILRKYRAIEVRGLDELTEVLAVCQGDKWPSGNRASVITASGGMAELILDSAPNAGIELPVLKDREKKALEDVIGHIPGSGNPLDVWGSGQMMTNLPHALSVVGESPQSDVLIFTQDAFDGQPMGGKDDILGFTNLLAAAASSSSKPHFQLNTRPGLMHRDQVAALKSVGSTTISGITQGLKAISQLAAFSTWKPGANLPDSPPTGSLTDLLVGAERSTINEHDAKLLLSKFGIPTTREILITDVKDLTDAASEIGFPLVLKAISDDLPHKSDAGLVVSQISTTQKLYEAWQELESRIALLTKPVNGILLQEMIQGGTEVFAGITRDDQFGLVLAFGIGGTAIELVDDVTLRILPICDGDVASMVNEIHSAPLLKGFRGTDPRDIDSLIGCIESLALFAWAERNTIEEVELNPIIVLPQSAGCVAVDALIVPRLTEGESSRV